MSPVISLPLWCASLLRARTEIVPPCSHGETIRPHVDVVTPLIYFGVVTRPLPLILPNIYIRRAPSCLVLFLPVYRREGWDPRSLSPCTNSWTTTRRRQSLFSTGVEPSSAFVSLGLSPSESVASRGLSPFLANDSHAHNGRTWPLARF